MSTFKVGEVAVLHGIKGQCSYLNGSDVTIIGGLAQRMTTDDELIWCYMVDICVGEFASVVPPHCLRKKRPPTTGEESILELFRQNQREGVAA